MPAYIVNQTPRLQLGNAVLLDATDRVEILWQTQPGEPGRVDTFTVEYRPADSDEWLQVPLNPAIETEVEGRVVRSATIPNLAYDTAYTYRVTHQRDGETIATYGREFQTRLAAGDDAAFSFATYGDSASLSGIDDFRQVQAEINRVDPDFSLLLGDNAYSNGTHQELDSRFDPQLSPEATDWIAGHIDYASIGNHDILTQGGRPTEESFSVPLNGPARERPEHNYAFDYGSAFFITFDSNSLLLGKNRLQRQLQWVEEQIAAANARPEPERPEWIVVVAHHPVGGVPDKELELLGAALLTDYPAQVVNRLYGAGADLLLSGHSHTYGTTYPLTGRQRGRFQFVEDPDRSYAKGDGLVQVVAGTGGRSIRDGDFSNYPFLASAFSEETSPAAENGFARVDVTPEQLVVSYATTSGQILDAFAIVDGEKTAGDTSVPTVSAVLDGTAADRDAAANVLKFASVQTTIELQLSDLGSGIADTTVTSAAIAITKDGAPYTDYTFDYDAASDRITLAAADGFAAGDYQIVLNGDSTDGIEDRAGLALLPTTLSVEIDPDAVFSVIGLPDTQRYSEQYPEIFLAQTQWIVDNRDALDIEFVSHYGDLVQHGTGPLAQQEFANAVAAMELLRDANVPHGFVAGNHDVLESGAEDQVYDDSNYLQYFGPQWYGDRPWYGGASPSGLSTYQTFGSGDTEFLALHLHLETPHSELAWAQGILNANRDKPVMVTTHRYLHDAQDYTGGIPIVPSGRYQEFWYLVEGQYNPDGIRAQEFFDHFVAANRNIFWVNAGHFHEEYRQTSLNVRGLPVHEVLADYQDDPNGGNGYLRIMEFDTIADRVNVSSYSPTLDNFLTADESQFSLAVDFEDYAAPNPTVSFQNGVGGYQGTQDTWINGEAGNLSYGDRPFLLADDDRTQRPQPDREGEALLKFADIFGEAANQIPLGATITRADLKLTLADDLDRESSDRSLDFEAYFLTRDWDESSTWNSLEAGLTQGDDYEALVDVFAGDSNLEDNGTIRYLNVLEAVQRWADGEANYGLAIVSENEWGTDDGIRLFSSEASQILFRPSLEVEFTLA